MKTLFEVELLKFEYLKELPNFWTFKNYRELLTLLEYGDTSDISAEDLKEMCLLSLTDNEPEEAARIVLEYVFKERLTSGQLDNLSHEIVDEKLWEEYSDLSMHEDFFNVTQLLYEAFNGKFPHPEAVKFQIKITTKDEEDLWVFKKNGESALIRLLTQGMPKNTLINRLYNYQIRSNEFNEARDIVWQYIQIETNNNSVTFEILSSAYWFKDLKYLTSFEAEMHSEKIIG
ncbi:hypothetical protein [Aquimarina latercula]|uniref:hypothetical protein n=1 Tax=Aquimarina latercula TaxID=987 RepID=UPI0004815227|nr:hypothetical protein [Aquimarina latercula]